MSEERKSVADILDTAEDLLLSVCPYFTGDDERRSGALALIQKARGLAATAERELAGLEDHGDIDCEVCGSTWCATAMYEAPSSVGAHSEDIGFSYLCPVCWAASE